MIFKSPHPDITIPSTHLTPFVFRHAERLADKPAIVDVASGRAYTYGQLLADARRLAAGLHRDGFSKGDVVAMMTPNVLEYPIVFHGVALAGGATTTLNPLYTAGEIATQLKDSGARILVTIPALAEKAREAAKEAGVERVVGIGGGEGLEAFSDLLSDDELPDIAVDPAEDVVALPYSSGTTGFSKGVMLTHRNLVANILQQEQAHRITEAESIIAFLPFFHIYGMQVLMNTALYQGATLLAMERFDLEQYLKTIQEYRPKRLYIVPPVALALAKHPMIADYDLSSVEIAFSGAAPLDGETAQACGARVGCTVIQGYGLTETSPVTHSVLDDATNVVPGSIGAALPNTEVKIVDIETGEELGEGQDGELWIRGAQIMKGYLNNPAATAACIDADGFFHTGDIGHIDDRGEYFIVDRLKELIKYKGLQVAPAELEAVLISHPKVTDAAVIGIPDEEAGELPKGFVVLSEELDPQEVMDYVAQRVAPHKKLRRLEVVDEIPKSASGKILRRLLRDREAAAIEA